jgi:hypothetical protein
MARTYQEKYQQVSVWVEIINEFWRQHQGVLNNQKDFWDTVMHSMTEQDWDDVNTVADILARQYPEDFRKFPGFTDALQDLNKRVMLGKPVIKKFDRQSYNKAPFKVIMSVKDKINELDGTPTPQFEKPKEVKQPETPNEIRKYRREINIQIQETLFEIKE